MFCVKGFLKLELELENVTCKVKDPFFETKRKGNKQQQKKQKQKNKTKNKTR